MYLMCVVLFCFFFFFKQKTAYEMRISDWSSDVCSSDLLAQVRRAERELNRVVAVVLGCADLRHDARTGLDDGDRDDAVVLVPDLGHADLLAEQADRKSVG